jgi:hypothetical protein
MGMVRCRPYDPTPFIINHLHHNIAMSIRSIFAPLTFACIVSSALANAQPADVTLLDPQSIAFARLDLTKIDPETLERSLHAYVADLRPKQFAADLAERNIRNLATRLRRLKQLKVEQVYLVITLFGVGAQYDVLLHDPDSHIYAVVAVPAGVDPLEVAKVIAEDPPGARVTRIEKDAAGNPRVWRAKGAPESAWLALHFHSAVHLNVAEYGNVVIAGSPDVLEYVAGQKAVQRPSLPAALTAAGDGPLQVVVAPPAVFGRVMAELLGPVKLDGLSIGNTLAEGFQWASLGIEEKEGELAARVVIQSRSAAGAKQMDRLIDLALAEAAKGVAKRDAQLGGSDSQFGDLAKLVNLEVVGDHLHWQIDGNHTPPAKVAAALRPVLLGQQIRLGLQQSINNLRHIGIALHNFYDVYNAFPTPATYDKDGKPLLSWRVHILPYVDESQLYREFRRDEPWDSEHNKKLIERMPGVYRRPFADPKNTKTPYQFPIGEKTVFQFGKKSTFADVRDGTAKTIGVVEVDPDHEVIWTKPDDWEVDWNDPANGLAGGPGTTFVACFLDAAVREIRESIDKDLLRGLLTGSGGEPLPDPDTFSD